MNATRSNACAQSAAALCVSLAMLSCAGATRKNAASASSALPSVVTPEELASESELQAQNPPAAGAKAPAAAPTAEFPILYVSAEPIDVREFLSAMWLRASDTSKEVIDKLVVESIAVMEAERLGLAVSPTKVDEGLEAAWKALGDRLERQGHGVSVAQYLRTELNLDSETYRKRLRHESLAQLVTERDVRIWACTRERRILYIVELADQKALDAFSAGLAAGRDFDSLAKELHVHKDKQRLC